MVEAQTKDYLTPMLWQTQATDSRPHMGKMCSANAGSIPAKRECNVAVEKVHGHVMDKKPQAASKVNNGPLKKKV
eukprot:15365007-Ditylum_brightwellii.AAC.1